MHSFVGDLVRDENALYTAPTRPKTNTSEISNRLKYIKG